MDANKKIGNIMVEGARIMYRNFQGKKTDFNEAGNRNFCLVLPPDMVDQVKADGWNVKMRKKRNEDEDDVYYIPVKVKYTEKTSPIANLITSRGQTRLTEDTIGQLDWARIKNIDLVVRPYVYPPSNICPEGGVSAYLKAIYVTIQEDPLEEKYASIPYADEEELPFKD